jgi:hypothetical protein
LQRMRTKALVAAFAIVAGLAMLASGPAGASRNRCGGSGGGGGVSPSSSGGTGTGTGGGEHRRTCSTKGYVNPFHAKHWWAGRIDMGVDYAVSGKRAPVVAIGDAKVIGSDSHSGWPGGHFLWYRILDGDHAGNIIYVAETLTRMVPKGTIVSAGDRVATALHGGTGIETGFANKFGSTRAAPCYSEGMKTNSGREMARFLHNLGAEVGDKPGPGADFPSGRRC